jgi:hypothetical protein
MQTIKIIQKKPEKYIPANYDEKAVYLEETLVDEVSLFEAKQVYRRRFSIKWRERDAWLKEHIPSQTSFTLFGRDPFCFSNGEDEPQPESMRWFDYVTFRDGNDIYYVLIITDGMVYIMNDQGQTIDSF